MSTESVAVPFVHLHVHSGYSFLDGANHPYELAERTSQIGMPALALTDHNSTAAVVKHVQDCAQYHILPILGAEVTMEDETHLTLLARNHAGFANLNRLISLAHDNDDGGERRDPHLPWSALGPHADGLICLTGCRRGLVPTLLRRNRNDEALDATRNLLDIFGTDRLYAELQDDFTPDSKRVCHSLVALARRLGFRPVATNNVHYATPEGYIAHDLLRAIATGTTLDDFHADRPLNRERYLKTPAEMAALFHWCPEAVTITARIAEDCAFTLPKYSLTPKFDGDAAHELRLSVNRGAAERYPIVDDRIRRRIREELDIIQHLGFTDFMLVCRDVVRWARHTAGIRCTGRGSAADSLVAYCLYLTDVDVISRGLPFARFLTEHKMPDVDVDFDKSRRDEVFHHAKAHYGADKTAMVCTFFSFHARSAVRDVGKALGLPQDLIDFFAPRLHWAMGASDIEGAFDRNAELKEQKHLIDRFKTLMSLCQRIAGLPRHIGTHSSGLMISCIPLAEVAPTIPSAKGILPILTLDKDDIDALKALKLDILALGSLASVNHAEEFLQRTNPEWRYDEIEPDNKATYAMISRGEAMGTHELQSPAQRVLNVLLQPKAIEDIEAAISLIRPATNYSGTPRENTVRRFLNARTNYGPSDYLHPRLRDLLAPTYGCIIYQEQVDTVVATMTNWSEADAEEFRKSLGKHTRRNTLHVAEAEFKQACLKEIPDIRKPYLDSLWLTIQGWGSYGFTHGHSASFAITSYRTAWLQVHEPAAFYAGLMSEYPMGYWPINTLASEARRRKIQLFPVCINESERRCIPDLQSDPQSIRLGFGVVSDLGRAEIETIEATRRADGPFASLLDFCARVVLRRDQLEDLILTGAFDSLHRHRRGLILRLDETLTLAAACRARSHAGQIALTMGDAKEIPTPCASDVAEFSFWDRMMWSWRITGVCHDTHPIALMRPHFAGYRILTTKAALQRQPKSTVIVAGLNVRPHRPPTRTGKKVLFSAIEDETGLAQTLAIDEALEKTTAIFLLSPAVIVKGIVERRGAGTSLLVVDAKPLRLEEIRK